MSADPTETLPPLPLSVAQILHTLFRARRSLAESVELFAQAGRDVANLTECVARLEGELKAAREAAK